MCRFTLFLYQRKFLEVVLSRYVCYDKKKKRFCFVAKADFETGKLAKHQSQ